MRTFFYLFCVFPLHVFRVVTLAFEGLATEGARVDLRTVHVVAMLPQLVVLLEGQLAEVALPLVVGVFEVDVALEAGSHVELHATKLARKPLLVFVHVGHMVVYVARRVRLAA